MPAVQRAGRRFRPRRPRRAAPSATATSSSSTGRRCGTRRRSGATTACCSPAPTPTCRSTTASRSCSSTWTRPASRCARSIQATGAAHFNEVFFDNVRVPVANVLGDIDNGWPAARTVMANESAMIGGGGASTFNNLLLLAQEFGRTGDPVARQRLIECYVSEKTLNLLADRIMGAIRRRERPPVDPSILKLSIALNKAVTGDVAVELAGAGCAADRRRDRALGQLRAPEPLRHLDRWWHQRGAAQQPRRTRARAPQGAHRQPRHPLVPAPPQLTPHPFWRRYASRQHERRRSVVRRRRAWRGARRRWLRGRASPRGSRS